MLWLIGNYIIKLNYCKKLHFRTTVADQSRNTKENLV